MLDGFYLYTYHFLHSKCYFYPSVLILVYFLNKVLNATKLDLLIGLLQVKIGV